VQLLFKRSQQFRKLRRLVLWLYSEVSQDVTIEHLKVMRCEVYDWRGEYKAGGVVPIVTGLAGGCLNSRGGELLVPCDIEGEAEVGGGLGARAVARGLMLRRGCALTGEAPFVPAVDGNAPFIPAPLLDPFTERSCTREFNSIIPQMWR
jgi:hypothetical protein